MLQPIKSNNKNRKVFAFPEVYPDEADALEARDRENFAAFDSLDTDTMESFESKYIENQERELLADPSLPIAGYGDPVIVGIDSEFVPGVNGADNRVLSVQLYMLAGNGSIGKVIYPNGPEKADRPSLIRAISEMIIEALAVGLIREWPQAVIVSGYFLRLDLASFSDFSMVKNQVDSAGGAIASLGSDAKFAIPVLKSSPMDEEPEEMKLTSQAVVTDGAGRTRLLRLHFIDIAKHVAPGKILADLGASIGIPKVEIPAGYEKSRLDQLLKDNPAYFELYGLNDAKIVAESTLLLKQFAKAAAGSRSLPATASSLAVALFKRTVEEEGWNLDELLGNKIEKTHCWDQLTRKPITKSVRIPCDSRKIHDPFITMCFKGGRNECYYFGPSEIGEFIDPDFQGAYPTMLASIGTLDYDNTRVTYDLDELCGDKMAFARVEFSFPDGTAYPCLAVDGGDRGQIYPLTGESFCTGPELLVAINMGCIITKVHHGVVIPWKNREQRIFMPFVQKIRELRNMFPKKSVFELYAKLLGNSLYGKTAQGLIESTGYNIREKKSVQIGESSITNAAIAAYVTGRMRAVLSELIANVPAEYRIFSATTDGFITDAPLDVLLANAGVIGGEYQAMTDVLMPGASMLEIKHAVHQLIAVRTRCQLTVIPHPDKGYEPILAKGGISPPPDVSDQSKFMVNLFLERKPGQKTATRPFTSLSQQCKTDGDVVRETREITMNMEPDFKRRPVNPRMVSVLGGEHIALDSVPWKTVSQALRARNLFDGWRKTHCLKTLDDWESWLSHYHYHITAEQLKRAGKAVGMRVNSDDDGSGVMRRVFIKAFALGLWGVNRVMSGYELADWLTANGYPTKVDEIKYAARGRKVEGNVFPENIVPPTKPALNLLELLKTKFPKMEVEKFLAAELID